MRIGLEDIDPDIAQKILERLAVPVREFLKEDIHWGGWLPYQFDWQFHTGTPRLKRKREPTPDERAAYELRRKREQGWANRLVFGSITSMFAGASVGGALATSGTSPALAAASGGLVCALGTVGSLGWAKRVTPKERLRKVVQIEEMRAVFPLLTLTRAERIYCDTLLLLARIEVESEAESTVRDTLDQINRLVDSARQLELRRRALVPILGSNSLQELEAEYGELGRRLDQTNDSQARVALQQSLKMCASRLENARTFESGLERLKAQEEAVIQTLLSAQTAIARMQLIPQAQTSEAAQEIADSVAQINRQTVAVEQAVEEVMQLRL